jgi:putative membrane protein
MTSTSGGQRFPRSVYAKGEEPDPRFSLANERTYLAWIRTSLALIAGGVALEALGLGLQPGLRFAASVVLIAAGLVTPVQGWLGWMVTERALRANRPLPSAHLALPVGIAVAAVGALVLLGVVFA